MVWFNAGRRESREEGVGGEDQPTVRGEIRFGKERERKDDVMVVLKEHSSPSSLVPRHKNINRLCE